MRNFSLVWNSDEYNITQVGWASQNVAEMLIPHNFVAILAQVSLELLETITETGEDGLDVTALLH